MDSADYLLLAAASLLAALICFASPVLGWIWRGDWLWPGWTIDALLLAGRGRRQVRFDAGRPASTPPPARSEPRFDDPLGRYNVGWVFLAIALALLAAAGIDAVSAT